MCTDRENLVLATRYIVQLIFSHTSAPAGSWAARPLRFLLCSEFYACPCVWQRASRASPSYAGIGKARTHRCRAARPCDSLCLATSDFCALSFCSQMNAMGFLFTLANKRERRKKKHTPGVWSTWQKGEWGPVTQTRAPAVSAELGHVTPRKLWFHPCTTDIVVNNPCSINQTMK